MPIEIEKKFLVANDSWRSNELKCVSIQQGYLSNTQKASIRVRTCEGRAFLNIKSATLGITRQEYEYEIPNQEGEQILLQLCEEPLIIKQRHYLQHQGHTWEIDVFEGDNLGLIVAEIELTNENEKFSMPTWVGQEVSDDSRYYNVCLVKHPYKNWKNDL